MSNYPEHDKLNIVKERSQAIGEFLEWLGDTKHYLLANVPAFEDDPDNERLFPVSDTTEKLLAEFFHIDLVKLDREKVAMLDALRQACGVRG